MNVLFFTISKITTIEERGIYTDLMRMFRDQGHNVYVVSPCERKTGLTTTFIEQKWGGILRVKTLNIQKTNLLEKTIATLVIGNQFRNAIKEKIKGVTFDLILYSTPPITFTSVIRYIKQRDKSLTYLLLKDIFPQNAVDMGLFAKWSPMYWWFRRKEKVLYEISDYIGCMSPANVEYILKHNSFVAKEKVEVNPNSIELVEPTQDATKKDIRKVYNLPLDIPIFVYGGNLGRPQGVDFLLKMLKSNIERKDCYFVVVGSGTEFNKVQLWFNTYNPSNARLIRGLSKNEYDLFVSCCDVGLIFLDYRFTIPNYPSRLLSYLENKLPIIAATDVNTDIGYIAEINGYGLWCESVDVEKFNYCLKVLFDKQKVSKMGMSGFRYLQNNYQVSSTYKIIMKHLNDPLLEKQHGNV